MFSLGLLAQAAKPAGSPFERPEVIWGTVGLVAALLAGAVVIYFVDRWRKRAALAERAAGEELTSFRAMYERGELTEEEYAKLRQRVADRVKKPPAPPAAGAAPGAGPTPAPPGPPSQNYFEDDPPDRPPPPRPPGGPPA